MVARRQGRGITQFVGPTPLEHAESDEAQRAIEFPGCGHTRQILAFTFADTGRVIEHKRPR